VAVDIGKRAHLVRRRNQTPQRTSARSGDAQATQSVARFVLSLPRSDAALAQRPISVGDRDLAARSAAVRDALDTPGRYLDIGEREQMKARAGADFTDMRLHTNLAAQRSTMEIGVHAYTSGHHIVAGALDRPAPHSVTSHSTPTSATNVPRVQRTPTPTERDAQPVRRLAVHDVLRSQGSPLTQPVRAEMEARLGADFSTARIHTDSTAQRSADELGARAYTVGENVVIGVGGIAPHVLAHELTHVIQQRQGPVDGTPQADGLSISDPSDRFEREAERNAVRAIRGTVDVQQATGLTGAPVGHVVQRYTEETLARKKGRLSQTRKYFLPDNKPAEIWVREGVEPPRYCRWTGVRRKEGGVFYYKYEPETTFRKDCLRTAEDVMHQKALAQGQVASAVRDGAPFAATGDRWANVPLARHYAQSRDANVSGVDPNDLEAPDVGQAYAIVETKYQDGNPDNAEEYPYHAAGVIAVDGGDRITLEALATDTDAEDLEPGPGTFHIYETDPALAPDGLRSFRAKWQQYFSADAITITLVRHGGENLAVENRAR
jgi:hypothetical protein